MSAGSRPRVALVAVGLGRVQRGFERYFSDLAAVLRGHLDITLFGSASGADGRRAPAGLAIATQVARKFPLAGWAGRAEYNRDCLAFGLTLLPALMGRRFDVVHCIDPPLAVLMALFRRYGILRTPVLFTEGCFMPPAFYPDVDHVHHVGRAAYEAAVAAGVPASRMTLVPCGLHTDRFTTDTDRASVRTQLGIRPETFVILAVSAVKRDHKRIDHLIEEVARLDGDVLLWIDGNPEDPSVPEQARHRLGHRVRVTHVPSAELPDLYRAADVFAHASLSESFGLAIVEALCAGLPILAHDSPHFEWLVEDRSFLVDMSVSGRLAARLEDMQRDDAQRRFGRARAARTIERFDWQGLLRAYVDLYEQVSNLPANRTSRTLAPLGARDKS